VNRHLSEASVILVVTNLCCGQNATVDKLHLPVIALQAANLVGHVLPWSATISRTSTDES
jgi:hypothetical protein